MEIIVSLWCHLDCDEDSSGFCFTKQLYLFLLTRYLHFALSQTTSDEGVLDLVHFVESNFQIWPDWALFGKYIRRRLISSVTRLMSPVYSLKWKEVLLIPENLIVSHWKTFRIDKWVRSVEKLSLECKVAFSFSDVSHLRLHIRDSICFRSRPSREKKGRYILKQVHRKQSDNRLRK